MAEIKRLAEHREYGFFDIIRTLEPVYKAAAYVKKAFENYEDGILENRIMNEFVSHGRRCVGPINVDMKVVAKKDHETGLCKIHCQIYEHADKVLDEIQHTSLYDEKKIESLLAFDKDKINHVWSNVSVLVAMAMLHGYNINSISVEKPAKGGLRVLDNGNNIDSETLLSEAMKRQKLYIPAKSTLLSETGENGSRIKEMLRS